MKIESVWIALIMLMIAGSIYIVVDAERSNAKPAPYYTQPSQYEREHGEPDRVCKWWGDGNSVYERAKRVECTVKGGE